MLGVLQGFTVILSIIGAGYLATLVGVVKGENRLVLNNVAFYFCTPALLFGVVMRSDPSVLASPVIVATSLGAILVAAAYVVASRVWLGRDLASTTLGAASSGYVNSNNLGLPIAVYILGDAAYVAPLVLVQVLFFSPVILSLLETTRDRSKAGDAPRSRLRGVLIAVRRGATNPIVIGTAAGLVCALVGYEPPAFIMSPIDMIGAASIPMILMSFGASLRGQRMLEPGTGRAAAFVSTGFKVLLMPSVTWLICLLLGLSPHETFVAVTIAALPTAQNIYNFAATYRRAEVQVRDTVFLTTFASLPVIAFVAWLLAA